MFVNTLCRSLQKLVISNHYGTQRCYTQASKSIEKLTPIIIQNQSFHSAQTQSNDQINFVPRSLNIDFNLPIRNNVSKGIMDVPVLKIRYEEKISSIVNPWIDLPLSDKVIDIPGDKQIVKKAIKKKITNIMKIRKHKIRKHLRKKLYKKMGPFWAKIRHTRAVKRDTMFEKEQIDKLVAAQKFDAEKYIKSRINIITEERLPITYRGEVLPSYMIKKFIEEEKAKKEFRRNRPRLKL